MCRSLLYFFPAFLLLLIHLLILLLTSCAGGLYIPSFVLPSPPYFPPLLTSLLLLFLVSIHYQCILSYIASNKHSHTSSNIPSNIHHLTFNTPSHSLMHPLITLTHPSYTATTYKEYLNNPPTQTITVTKEYRPPRTPTTITITAVKITALEIIITPPVNRIIVLRICRRLIVK